MLAVERQRRIESAVSAGTVLSTDMLAEQLGVSVETVRRDLIALDRAGRVSRVHGGVTSAARQPGYEASFADRSRAAHPAKAAIGRAGATRVSNGQTVVFDVGTTVLEVARALPNGFRGTVATCSLLVAAELAGRRGIDVLVCGGRVRGGDLACSNNTAVDFFTDVHADVAFLGSGGVDANAGLTDFYIDEVATRRVILTNTATTYVLADSSKLGVIAPHRVCELDQFSALITDRGPVAALGLALRRAGASVIVA